MSLDRRVTDLETRETLENLVFAYARTVDDIVNDRRRTIDFADQLTSDVRWISTHCGDYAGRPAFERFLAEYRSRVSLSLTMLSGSVLEIDDGGDGAFGEWAVWQPLTVDAEAWIFAGRFRATFERAASGWLIASASSQAEILVPWRDGWGPQQISSRWPLTQPR